MAFEIILKKRFTNKVDKTLSYLETEWSHITAVAFLQKLDRRIEQLKSQPHIGAPSLKIKNVRGILITRHNRMYYKIHENKVIILNMYDTRMNPSKNPY
ncbi:MAG TPA: type II toxin-antitoxin system RelE/ParE family toxin [Lacibacter sp.]|jgi:plasmid stabilization system protein ParE|nr:type II toxin-antitoxin system RelE/ParE family toxin [Lacibacter sp.]